MSFKAFTVLGLVTSLGVAFWVMSTERREWLLESARALRNADEVVEGVPRRRLGCQKGTQERRFVALTFGQSNAANYVRGRHASASGVISYYRGRCYAAKDPLPGAGGTGGSVWSRLGDFLIAGGDYDQVVIAGIAVSASEAARWTVGGDLHPRLIEVLADMHAHGLTPTHLLWHQGETDAKQGTDAETYRRHFLSMIDSVRAQGVAAPVYVATASYCHGRSSPAVRAAQVSLVDPDAGIHAGPDTDSLIGPRWRHDDCHFSADGAVRHAALWRDALLAPRARQ
jgi:hypothetical protein